MLLLFISFIAGVLTVLAPCILPLLPIVVGGSLYDGKLNKKKAVTVVGSLGVSVILFTLLLKVSTLFITIPQYTWTLISGGIILLIGIVTIFPSLWENQLIANLSSKSNILLGKGDQKKSFWGDVIVGASLGPVFSTCSPTYFIVLATVLPVNPSLGILYLLSYVVGLCLSLFIVALIGQNIMDRLNIAADPNGKFKKILGTIFILVGIAILSGYDKKIQADILSAGFFDVTNIEHKLLEIKNSKETTSSPVASTTQNSEIKDTNQNKNESYLSPMQKELRYSKVPELSSIDGYINTDGKPITLQELRGKVVLLDIWTYSCINCQRTLPYINNWYAKYKDQGFVVVGLHTPEFGFEKVQSNVEDAVKKLGIKYPVVLDNDYSTWQALGNNYWPRKYLIDIDGYIVYDHAGEGEYAETEVAIQQALKERAYRMGMNEKIPTDISKPSNAIQVDSGKVGSPETYFGSNRNSYLVNGDRGVSGEQSFLLPEKISPNGLYLSGKWNINPEYAENEDVADIVFNYQSKNVYMAAGADDPVDIEVYKDNVLVKKIKIKEEQLYQIIDDKDYGSHILHIKIINKGLKAFTFTFG